MATYPVRSEQHNTHGRTRGLGAGAPSVVERWGAGASAASAPGTPNTSQRHSLTISRLKVAIKIPKMHTGTALCMVHEFAFEFTNIYPAYFRNYHKTISDRSSHLLARRTKAHAHEFWRALSALAGAEPALGPWSGAGVCGASRRWDSAAQGLEQNRALTTAQCSLPPEFCCLVFVFFCRPMGSPPRELVQLTLCRRSAGCGPPRRSRSTARRVRRRRP